MSYLIRASQFVAVHGVHILHAMGLLAWFC